MIQVDGYVAQTLNSIDELFEIDEPFSILYASEYFMTKYNGVDRMGDFQFIYRTSNCLQSPIVIDVNVFFRPRTAPAYHPDMGEIRRIDNYTISFLDLEELVDNLPKGVGHESIFVKLLSRKGNA